MEILDDEARAVLENNIDYIMKSPKESEQNLRDILNNQGIKPTLETILSFVTGLTAGIVEGFYIVKYGRFLNAQERNELISLLQRRASELREAFISTRMDTQ